ncbi:MAG TPA: hypothetical protein VI687_01910 [Candidatus Limnocylindrales bacterium]|nr:hypothetical protein [Candidatus Limnocylindrales bacterium]
MLRPLLATVLLAAFPMIAAAQTLTEVGFIRTTPFAGSTVSMGDGEGMAFVPLDNALWLVDDHTKRVYEVDRTTGQLRRFISQSVFANTRQFGGTALAGSGRTGDLEAAAYDAASDELYVFNSSTQTAYRLKASATTGALEPESWQPFPSTIDPTGAAWHPLGALYVSAGKGTIRKYNYEANTLGPLIALPGVSGVVFGMGFNADGSQMWVVTSADRLYRVDWATLQVLQSFDLTVHNIHDARAVEVIDGAIYVLDGYALPASDPKFLAVTLFVVEGEVEPPPPPPDPVCP